jgi:DnaK suppressor protein
MSQPLIASQLDQLAQLLNSRLHEFTSRVDSMHQQGAPVMLDQQSAGRMSLTDAIGRQQVARNGERQAIEKIKQLQSAHLKIQDDDYGWCNACGEIIGFARLSIQSEAIKCVRCQQSDEVDS